NQKQKLNDLFYATRYIYNLCVQIFSNDKNKKWSANAISLRNHLLGPLKKKETKTKTKTEAKTKTKTKTKTKINENKIIGEFKYSSKVKNWLKSIPYDVLDEAIRDFCKAVKTCKSNLQNRNI